MTKEGTGIFVALWLAAVVLVLTTFGLLKLGSAMFDNPSTLGALEASSIRLCDKEHGTPVLEDNGQAYKSCAIDGKSNTRNVVK